MTNQILMTKIKEQRTKTEQEAQKIKPKIDQAKKRIRFAQS